MGGTLHCFWSYRLDPMDYLQYFFHDQRDCLHHQWTFHPDIRNQYGVSIPSVSSRWNYSSSYRRGCNNSRENWPLEIFPLQWYQNCRLKTPNQFENAGIENYTIN